MKDRSSRLLRLRLRIEEYKYEVVYVKGKKNKAADCLSRLFPIQSQDQSQISDSIIITARETETPPRRIREPSETDTEKSETDTSTVENIDQEQLYADFVLLCRDFGFQSVPCRSEN